MFHPVTLLTLSTLLLLSVSIPLPWPRIHQNDQNTNLSPFAGTTNPLACNVSYGLQYGRHVLSTTPILGTDNNIFVSSNWNSTVVFNQYGNYQGNFSMLGMNDFNSATYSDDGILYLTNFDGNLYAFDTETNALLWKFATDNNARIQSSVTIGTAGVLFFGADDYQLYSVFPNGTKQWSFLTQEAISQSPAVFDSKVIFGSYDSMIYCLNEFTGQLIWTYKTGAPIWSASPAISEDGTVYVASDDKYLYAFDIDDGTLKWRAKTGGKLRSTPSIGPNGDIYVSCTDSHIYAYTPDGEQKWLYDVLDKDLYASPAISQNNLLYVGTASRNASQSDFLCIDADSGEKVWNVSGYFNVTGTASIGSNGAIYFATQKVELFAIFDLDSTPECPKKTPVGISTSPIIQPNPNPSPFETNRVYRPLNKSHKKAVKTPKKNTKKNGKKQK